MFINEGGDFILNTAFVSGAAATTAYFLLSTQAVIAANLTAAVSLPQATIPLDVLDAMPSSGNLIIGSQTVAYTGKSAGTGAGNLTGCTGGTGAFPAGAYVYGSTGWLPTMTLAGGVGEVTYWTTGGRLSQVVPTSVNKIITFVPFAFNSGVGHTDGPASVKSYAWVTTPNNTGVVIAAANVTPLTGAAVSMAAQSANLAISPVYFLQNIGGSA
jgi:hypothetical protein